MVIAGDRRKKPCLLDSHEYGYLPDDCWELIFQKLGEDDERDLDAISLVSKRFLSISNRLKHSLKVNTDAKTLHLLPNILRRFRHIKSIVIAFTMNTGVYGIIEQIGRCGLLNLQALRFQSRWLQCRIGTLRDGFRALALSKNMKNNLKVLDCSGLISMKDKDLIMIANLFPQLEELRIHVGRHSHDEKAGAARITDDGVDALALKLKELKEVVFSFDPNSCFITDKSLISLSTNCVKLRKIHLDLRLAHQHKVTEDGIDFVMRHSTNLTSLYLDSFSLQPSASPFLIGSLFTNAKNLHSLTLRCEPLILDKHISLLAKACPPLKKLEIVGREYPKIHVALKLLLHSCQSTLEKLTLSCSSLKNTDISNLAQYLSNLTSIYLDGWHGLTSVSVTFYTLTKSCPRLEILTMKNMIGQEMDTFSPNFLHKSYRMRHLDISNNQWLNDTILGKIGWVCPNLQFLRVSSCPCLTNVGIGQVLRRCPAITQLNIQSLKVSNDFLGRYSDNSIELNLKTLKACWTNISDEGMVMIGKRCPNLQDLDIRYCNHVTDKGVIEVVRKCERLRNINLCGCEKVISANILPEVVLSRPSLRKINLRSGFDLSEQMMNTVSSFGCRIISTDDTSI